MFELYELVRVINLINWGALVANVVLGWACGQPDNRQTITHQRHVLYLHYTYTRVEISKSPGRLWTTAQPRYQKFFRTICLWQNSVPILTFQIVTHNLIRLNWIWSKSAKLRKRELQKRYMLWKIWALTGFRWRCNGWDRFRQMPLVRKSGCTRQTECRSVS